MHRNALILGKSEIIAKTLSGARRDKRGYGTHCCLNPQVGPPFLPYLQSPWAGTQGENSQESD